ncbi:hypothetical protein [Prevotella sp. 10(H)]|uniref:hypothetical protein n=1 Tax=Prevotella sp. 10(H) TaxID=1158294 RepID=UPI0004A6F7F2|nr:hypothetical protein [Prevotella sp. 10(H)]
MKKLLNKFPIALLSSALVLGILLHFQGTFFYVYTGIVVLVSILSFLKKATSSNSTEKNNK